MFPLSFLIKSDTVEPGYLEHSAETEIRLIWRGFFTSKRSLRQSKPKGNKKRLIHDMGIRYILRLIQPSSPVYIYIHICIYTYRYESARVLQ